MPTTTGIRRVSTTIESLPEIARQFLNEAGEQKVFALYGTMGSGKTTFIKALCRELGVQEIVTSPTFTIVNEYLAGDQSPVFHFDFYRIKSESEAYDLGYENYLYSGNYCFVEWPEKIASLLPPKLAKIHIDITDDQRSITLTV